MSLIFEIIKFIIYVGIIVFISKNILVTTLRKLAENLNLKPKTVGDIAGIATSVPEFLTISASSFSGLIGASVFNILSSNVINLIQYLAAIFINKNQKAFKNQALKVDIVLVIATIVIPIILITLDLELNSSIIIIFLILYALFRVLNNNAHKVFLKNEDAQIEAQIEKEEKWERNNKKKTIKYISILLVVGILLFIVGDLLGNTIEKLCNMFNIPQLVIGIILGFATSIPELITFFESQRHYKNSKSDDILGVVEATNNLLQSNMLNLFIIQSVGILIFLLF